MGRCRDIYLLRCVDVKPAVRPNSNNGQPPRKPNQRCRWIPLGAPYAWRHTPRTPLPHRARSRNYDKAAHFLDNRLISAAQRYIFDSGIMKPITRDNRKPSANGLANVMAVVLNYWVTASDCRDSDCKVALNPLIRAYGDLFCHREPNHMSKVASVGAASSKTKDHVIPVRELMLAMMDRARLDCSDLAGWIENFLNEYSIVCLIDESEDQLLRANGLWNKMPENASFHNGEFCCIWARYLHPKINISRSDGNWPR